MEVFTSDIKYLKRNEKLSFKDEKENSLTHKLIIGDNYPALKNLLLTHRHKVDVIYIDPPYGSDSMGKFAETNYQNNITRDNLLSMLYPRLLLSKQLLSDNGIIFCSIDNKNYAYIKCLFDEIFGEKNYVSTLNWKKKKQPSFLSVVAEVIEYVLVYTKTPGSIKKLSIETLGDEDKPIINSSNEYSERLIKKGCSAKCEDGIIPKGIIKNKTMSIEFLDDVCIKNGEVINDFRCKAKFRTTQENINEFCDDKLIFVTKNYGLRRYLTKEEINSKKSITDLLLDWGQNQDGTKELKEIFNIKDDTFIFSNPKPVLLIKNIIKSVGGSEVTVLDFFAGSGTTGQAVLELNKEDGGNRQFILCTNNEKEDGYIAETVTSKRLKRVMTGSCYDGNTDFEWIKKNEPYGDNLEVFDIAEVSANISDGGTSPFDVIDETCYDKKFDNIQDKIDWICNNFQGLTKKLED